MVRAVVRAGSRSDPTWIPLGTHSDLLGSPHVAVSLLVGGQSVDAESSQELRVSGEGGKDADLLDSDQVIKFGATDAILPELPPGGSHRHLLALGFLVPGAFTIDIECTAPLSGSGSGQRVAIRIPHLEDL